MAMVFNGTSQRSIATLSTPLAGGAAFSAALTFKTGSTVLAWQRILSLQSASGLPYGFGFSINSSGNLVGIYNNNGAELSTTSLGAVSANTIYRAVITKDAGQFGHFKCYLNAIGTTVTATNVNDLTPLARYTFGARISGSVSEYFWGKEARIALFDSVLSGADISVCLNPNNTPLDSSVAPIYYWDAVSNGNATIGGVNLTLVNGVTFDSDTLISSAIQTITDPIPAGGNLAFTATGLGTVTSITTNIADITVGAITGTGASGGATVSGFVDGQPYPDLPTAIVFTFTDGVFSPTKGSNISVPSEFNTQVFAEWTVDNPTYLGSLFNDDGFDVVGSKFFYIPYSDLTIGADTKINVATAGTIIGWIRPSTGFGAGNMYQYTIDVTESGAVVVDQSLSSYVGFGLGFGFGETP